MADDQPTPACHFRPSKPPWPSQMCAGCGYWREDHKCDADVTLRDDDHQLAVCGKPSTHTDAHYDSELGVTWTDGHHA